MNARKRVLLLTWNHFQPIFQGIVRYAHEANWILCTDIVYVHQVLEHWHHDGIISFHGNNPAVLRLIRRTKAPVVELGLEPCAKKVIRVCSDNPAIAKMAANYLIKKGYSNFAFYPAEAWARIRRTSFEREITAQGKTFRALPASLSKATLIGLPKPTAVFCANDAYASRFIDSCMEAGVPIPEAVSVLGVDNLPELCDLAAVPISSVDTDLEGRGYTAARLLDHLMNGGTPPGEPILIPPKRVVTRMSTDILAVSHPKVAQALRHILTHYASPDLNIASVAKSLGITRRRLDDAFKKHLGCSLFEELMSIRLKKAKALLLEGNMKFSAIATESGFSGGNHLRRAFVKYHSCSVKQYKESVQGRRI